MAVLYVTEFQYMGQGGTPPYGGVGGPSQFAQMPPVAVQTVAIAGGSTASLAFSAQTLFVRLETDAICSVKFSANPGPGGAAPADPVAATTDMRMAINSVEYFGVAPNMKLAVIANS